MKQITLTQGQVALVDDEDYKSLMTHKWCAKWDPSVNTWYAVRNTPRPEHKCVWMHRVVMGITEGFVDHKDHNGLNNCKNNLRICTNSQNQHNRSKRGEHTSIYKGVCWDKSRNNWKATIMINRKVINLGRFKDEKEAAKSYNEKAKELFGEYAKLNLF
jgi:hypothetical protein